METINKLIKIHKTRKRAYEKALKETKEGDEDLRHIFKRMVEVSHIYSQELSKYINPILTRASRETTGKIYSRWMRIKTFSPENKRQILLGMCKWGEDIVQNAYTEALETSGYSTKIQYILYKQKEVLKASSNLIKDLMAKENKELEMKPEVSGLSLAEVLC